MADAKEEELDWKDPVSDAPWLVKSLRDALTQLGMLRTDAQFPKDGFYEIRVAPHQAEAFIDTLAKSAATPCVDQLPYEDKRGWKYDLTLEVDSAEGVRTMWTSVRVPTEDIRTAVRALWQMKASGFVPSKLLI